MAAFALLLGISPRHTQAKTRSGLSTYMTNVDTAAVVPGNSDIETGNDQMCYEEQAWSVLITGEGPGFERIIV
jgi:hypothetical protein